MKHINLRTEALIIAEITGSITSEERAELEELRRTSSEVRALSEDMHKVLDTDIDEISEVRNTSAQKIIELGKAHLYRRGKIRKIIAVSVAAALVGTFFTLFHYYGPESKPEMLFGKGQDVLLDMDKKVIVLSGQGGEINAAGSLNYNGDKTLSVAQFTSEKDSLKLIVPQGREYKMKLNDGTVVHMNGGSVLSWPVGFGEGKREISIRGEAFLEVVKNDRMPFRVRLFNEMVEVLGTSFNVKAYDERSLQVSLISGNVNVEAKGQRVNLEPGQEAVYRGEQLQIRPFDMAVVSEWRQRVIDLPNAGTKDIERVVARIHGEKVEFDPDIRDVPTRISIDREMPVEVFLGHYAEVHNLKYSKEDGIYRLSLSTGK